VTLDLAVEERCFCPEENMPHRLKRGVPAKFKASRR